MKPSSSSTIPQ